MQDRIETSLRNMFDEHRIVFWYDAAKDMRETFEALTLEDVEKVEVVNNEFGLKRKILRTQPKHKFLIYREGAEPPLKENWLLDLQLASAVFKADQAAIWLAELGLPAQFEEVVSNHLEFYRSKTRIEHFAQLIQPEDTKTDVLRRMLAVCAGTDGGLDVVVEEMLGELAQGEDDALRLMERTNLLDFFWKQLDRDYGYASGEPDFEDFAITLFQSAYQRALSGEGALNSEALLLFRRWKNNRHWADVFEALSEKYQEILKVPDDLVEREPRDLRSLDHFEEVDRHIIRSVVTAMSSQTISSSEVLNIVRERRQSHWYPKYKDIYLAIGFAIEFQQAIASATLGMTSPEEGVKRYTGTWFKLDQLYRKFIYHRQKSGQASLLSSLYENIENLYTNSFLLTVNDAWQDQVAHLSKWDVRGFPRQMDFYQDQAAKFRRMDQKVVVIISDALRYEVAEECLREIRKLNRFDAELHAMIGSLPSYTQLGMAALLPNEALTLQPDGSGGVLSFGETTQGITNREKLLSKGRAGDRVKAMKSEDFMELRADDGKEIFRDHDILYLYHNRIDAIGDKLQTEEGTPEAVEHAIQDLTKLVRKLTTANFSNILITADHGFLFQHRALDDSEFSVADPQGDEILFKNRRFVLGRGLKESAGMKRFSSAELGLEGDLDVLIPNSINRMRIKGAGSRFVHGGASLQEVIVPVLRVGKQREADVSKVEVQIIVSGKSLISSGQTAVTLYQAQAVSEKLQQRELLAGIYTANGKLISDEHQLTFDFASGAARERELPLKFLLSREADSYNNQDVFLKLRERVGKTSHYEDYASHKFQLRRGLTTDFDF